MKKKLKKLKFGDYINEETAPLLNTGASLIDAMDTPNSYGVQSTGGAAASGVLKGAAAGAAFGLPGVIIGGALSGITSLLGNEKAKEAEEKAKQEQQALQLKNLNNYSQSVLATYPSYGILTAKYGSYLPMAKGGQLPIPTDDSQVKQLASNTAIYKGETHENGGIKLDTNNDSQADVEVEDEEVINEDMVLSDRLYPSSDFLDSIKGLGINIKKGDTYASLAERFAKKKGEYEGNLNSTKIGQAGTARLMIEKFDSVLDGLFQDQELQKMNTQSTNKMNYGGWLPSTIKGKKGYYIGSDFVPKMPDGGKIDPNKPKKTETGLAPYFNDPKTKQFVNDKGWITREDYNKWKKAWNNEEGGESITWGTDLGGNANLFWGDNDINEVKSKFDNDPTISRIRVGEFKGEALNKYLYPKGAPSTFEPYRNRSAGIIEFENYGDNTQPPIQKQPEKVKWVTMDSNTYPTNYSTGTVGAGNTANMPKGSTRAYGMNYAKGGTLPMYRFGGYEGDVRVNAKDPLTLDYTPLLEPKGRITYPFKRQQKEISNDVSTEQVSMEGTPNNRREFEIPDMTSALATAGFLGNKSQLNKLETEYTPTLSQNPAYNFTNRLPRLNQDIEKMFMTAVKGIRGSSAQDNQALYSNMYAKGLNNLNRASLEETAREDAFKANYNNLVQRNNMYNTSAINQAKYASMDNRNQKIALNQQNQDAFIKSLIGNQFVKDQQDLDFAKNYFELLKEGDTGVSKRMLDSLPSKLRKRYIGNYYN